MGCRQLAMCVLCHICLLAEGDSSCNTIKLLLYLQEFLEHEDVALTQSGLDYTDSPSVRRGSSTTKTAIVAMLPLASVKQTVEKVQLSSTHFADSVFIKVSNMSASWTYSETKLVLEDIHFEVNEVRYESK